MATCPEHGLRVGGGSDDRFCRECGAQLIEDLLCLSCRRYRAKQDKHCGGCGVLLPPWKDHLATLKS